MGLTLDTYRIKDAGQILTPALLIYPAIVDANIRATLKMVGNDPNRWRPHIKTAKVAAVLKQLLAHAVGNFKCSTTLELLTACEARAKDVLVAYPMMGANARRTREIAAEFPGTQISVLIETLDQAAIWSGTNIGMFIDVNPGMNRTGIAEGRAPDIVKLAQQLGRQFRGIHYYDGHMSGVAASEREARAHEGYDRLLHIVERLGAAHVPAGEVITSGTPAAPFAISYSRFRSARFVHRISPGTVVYNDMTSLEQLPEFGYEPAAIVLSTVVSRPTERSVTCDAGHKSVSADAGIPTCAVIGHSDWKPMKPSEEHLPIEIPSAAAANLGDRIYLLPHHVCPTVNNFDQAIMVREGNVASVEPVSARGHESPLRSAACVT
jgi:D-serine deaminase-like pyridoxal phosphate-dependent protein